MSGKARSAVHTSGAENGQTDEVFVLPIADVATYVADMVDGIRSVTSAGRGEEMRFLDGLLAMAVSHAKSLARGASQPRGEDLRARQRTRKSS